MPEDRMVWAQTLAELIVNSNAALRNVRKALLRTSEVGETVQFVPIFVFLGISPCVRDAVSIITVTLTLMSSIIIIIIIIIFCGC